MLGFRVDPADALETVYKEVMALYATAVASPDFGIEYSLEEAPESAEAMKGKGPKCCAVWVRLSMGSLAQPPCTIL